MQRASAAFDPTAFDTISWNSPEEQLERGAVVWRFSCRKCHGDAGLGDGELARVEELDMPEILAADWEYEGDIPAIRRRVYTGHESEMPSWDCTASSTATSTPSRATSRSCCAPSSEGDLPWGGSRRPQSSSLKRSERSPRDC